MLILVLVLKDIFQVLVLKDIFKSLSLSWSLGVRSLSLSWSLGSGPCPCGSGPCPYPGPCGLVLVLVFSPCKDLFPLFRFICILLCQCIQLVLIILTYVFPASYCFASINTMSVVLPCSSVIIIDIIRLIISMVIIAHWSSILKVVMKI